jgi:hypothetical protein
MEYKDFFSPKTLEKLNTKSAENLKTMLGDKSLMQTIMSSNTLMSQISKAEEPYKTQLENLAVKMIKELYPIIDEEGIVLDAKISNISDIGRGLDEIRVNKPNPLNYLQNLQSKIKATKDPLEKLSLAIQCVERVLFIFEEKFPDDKRPRKAIEAAKAYLANPTEDNGKRVNQWAENIHNIAIKTRDAASKDVLNTIVYMNYAVTHNDTYLSSIDIYINNAIDYAVSAAKEYYNPNKISLNESITPESRRRIINAITQGAALRGAFAFYLFKEHLDDLDPTLVNNYNQIMKNSFGIYDDENAIAMMLAALAQGQKMAGGSSKVIINEIKVNTPNPLNYLLNLQSKIEATDDPKEKLSLAIQCAERVLFIWEEKYPNNKSPRKAIEAAKVYLANPTEENKKATNIAATDAAYAGMSKTIARTAAYAAVYVAVYAASGATAYADYAASEAIIAAKEYYNLNEIKINEAESGITIQARAANFPMLVHELIKGLYELLSLQGFKGDKTSNQAVADKVDLLKNEPSDIRYGKFIFDALNKIFINSEYNDPRIREFFLTEIYQLGDEEFIQFIENAVNEELTQTQTQWANSTLRDIASDLKADDYESTGLDEIKVNTPRSLKIIKLGDNDWGLLVNDKYLFADTYHHPSRPELNKYEIIYAQLYVDEYEDDPNESLEVFMSEPSFGGGAPEEEIEAMYDSWEKDIAIAEEVLAPYSHKSNEDTYYIKLKKISGTDLIHTLNEIKVNQPGKIYYLNPKFEFWLTQDHDEIRYNFDEDTADALYMFKLASKDNKIIRNQDVETLFKSDPDMWSDSTLDSFIDFLLDYNIIQLGKPSLNEIKVNKPGFNFNNFKTIMGFFNTDTDVFKKDYIVELIDLDEYYSLIPFKGQSSVILIPKQYIEVIHKGAFKYKKEISKEEMNQLKKLINQNKIINVKSLEEDEPGYNPLPLSYGSEYGRMRENKSFKESFLESIIDYSLLNEYSEKTINTTIERWKTTNPEIDENTAKQLIQRFDQIKSGLSGKLNVISLPDTLKQGQNYLNIDKYSFEDMVKLIQSLPENPEKIKKDAIGRFVQRDGIDKATAQSYIARFISKKDELKYAVENGTEDGSFTKEEVKNFIPKKLLNNNAYLDPRVWGWIEFEQMLDALFPSQRAAGDEGENLVSTDADKIYDKGGIEIYKGDDVHKCISYNPTSTETKRKKYGWCVTQVGNTNYDYYRFRDKSPTFYFVFDRSKDSSPEHATFNDEWHAFVVQVNNDGESYIVTGANNRGDINADSWEGISKIVPSETWAKIKGLKDYFKPINLSAVERGRKFASGKNLSLNEFKELSQDEKILYIQGKASKNEISNEILEILPQYKINLEGRSTTLANIAIDSGQTFPYSALKNNEALAKRYAIFRFRHTDYSKNPIPLPYVKYLDDEAKQKYLNTFDDNLTFEYIEKYFGQTAIENYVNKQIKKLDYLPKNAIKYIKDPKLKTLFGIYSKLFDSWEFGSNTNLSDEALESAQNMPEQDVNPIPINLKQWLELSPQEKKIIIELTEKYNQNPDYSTLAYASPFIIKDGAETYTLLPGKSDNYNYTDWVLLDKNNNVIKKLPEGTSLGGMDLISGYPTAEDNFKRVWNLKDLKIEK